MKQYRYVFGELKGDIRICKCGEVTLEDDMHLCKLTEVEVPDENSPHEFMAAMEDKKGLQDFGRMGLHILTGAKLEGATDLEAFLILKGFFAGISSATTNTDESDEKTPSS